MNAYTHMWSHTPTCLLHTPTTCIKTHQLATIPVNHTSCWGNEVQVEMMMLGTSRGAEESVGDDDNKYWSKWNIELHDVEIDRSLWWNNLFLWLSEHSSMILQSSHSTSSASLIQLWMSLHSSVYFRLLFVRLHLSSFIWLSLSFLLRNTCFIYYYICSLYDIDTVYPSCKV